ncbi:glutamate receptor ionotropic, kainate 2-like isoform X6 [Temnothorax americanus]|uniref:glutamate receptor ionotropic, kainate 2-like isoform X6 n=1 Tax=Temnothorax americanus TaxID=1964332 RepID=UPI00406907F9
MNDREMLLLYVTVAFMPHILGLPRRISIGGLFDGDEMIEKAFEISIKTVNKKMSTPERARNISLTPITKQINKNAFQVANIAFLRDHIMHFWELHHAACELIDNGIIGIFGPQDKSTASYVQSMCDTLDIPHIAARWDSELKRGNVINLHPHPDSFSMVFQNLIEEYKWKEYAIIYDNTDGLIRINRLLKLQNLNTTFAMVFHLGSGPNFRQTMEEVKMSGYKNLVIDCSYNILASVLEQAQQVGIMSERYRVIITSLNLQTLDLEPYQYSGVNLTGVRLIDPKSSIVRRALRSRNFKWNLPDGSHLRVEAALAYDAVQLFASGYARLRKGIKGNLKNLSCSSTEVWEHGFSLSNYMRNERIHGLTGLIRFDTAGFRTEFQLDIVNLGNEGLYKVGRWETNFGIQWKPGYRIPGVDDDKSLRDKHFLVLISLKADLAITDLTITATREEAVDFTSPFMNLGISVLYRMPTKAPPGLLSFLGPFSKDVWAYLIGAYLTVTTLLFVIGKLCPVEWKNPYPCIKEPEVLETPFTLTETPFLVSGAILKSPTGFAPAGISTRALAVAWWFFALIITNTYIANLAAALSTKSVVWSFQVAEELAYQQKIKYGAKINGSTYYFFQDSTYEPYVIMYNYMKDHANEVLMKSNEDGVRKVQNENYAYFMESSSIEYTKQRKCNVTQIGGLLDSKSYGIAMKKDASYRMDLSGAILKLHETGVINELQTKWWKQKRGGDTCDEKTLVQVQPLNLEDVGGVFLIMISGVASSWIFTGCVFLWNIRNIAIRHDVSFKKELINELKFLIKCSRRKIVKRRKKSVETITNNSTDS